MNSTLSPTAKSTLVITIVLLPVMLLAAIGSAVAGLEALNAENHGKSLVFAIGNDAASTVKNIFLFVVAPLSVFAVLLAIINLKFKNNGLNKTLLFLCGFFVCWLIFATWALDTSFVSRSGETENNSYESDNEGLRIRTMDIN